MNRRQKTATATATATALLAITASLTIAGCASHRIVANNRTLPGDYSYFLLTHKLAQCPSPDFVPASLVKRPKGIELRAGLHDGPYCHGFLKYELRETTPIFVRFTKSAPCAIVVAVPEPQLCSGRSLTECEEYRHAAATSRTVTELLVAESSLMIDPAPTEMNGIKDESHFERWCHERVRKKVDATAHPTFKMPQPPRELPPNVD